MTDVVTIRRGKELGFKDYYHPRIWAKCPKCGLERWVLLHTTKRRGYTGLCHRCNTFVRGGGKVKKGYKAYVNGYILIKLQPEDFFLPMTNRDGYVLEHRLVMAKYLGRCLQSWEIVHHKGTKYPKGGKENRGDNRIENLQLVIDDRHKQISILETKIVRFQKKNEELEAELGRLKNDK